MDLNVGNLEALLAKPLVAHSPFPPYLLKAIARNSEYSNETRQGAHDLLESLRKTEERPPPFAPSRQVRMQAPTPTQVPPPTGPARYIYSHPQAQNATLLRKEGEGPCDDKWANDVYDFFGQVLLFYRNGFGRNSFDNKGGDVKVNIHHVRTGDAEWDNDAKEFNFGDGGPKDSVIPSGWAYQFDIVAHEFAHAVTGSTADLSANSTTNPQGKALNESISDVFASIVKQHAKNQTADTADWLIGVGAFEPNNPNSGLRSLKEPGKAWKTQDDKDQGVSKMKDYKSKPAELDTLPPLDLKD